MIKTLLIFSLLSFIQLSSCSKNEIPTNENANSTISKKTNPTIIEKNSKTAFDGKSLTISQLNKQKPSKGIFETKGFVAKIYTCPPCPPDAQCKPCMGDNIVISEDNKSLDIYDLTEKEMIIFTNKAESFSKGKEYKFKVKITDDNTTSANLNDAELLSAELIKD